MLNREDVARLLRLQADAYELLMWLGRESILNPDLLSPSVVTLLGAPETTALWLEQHRERLPAELLPAEPPGLFSSLFCSFFSTSFQVRHLELGERLLDSRLTLGAAKNLPSRIGLEQSQALALKHLAAFERMPISEQDARRLVKRKALREAALLWGYVWELDRRAKNKGKGPVVHRIWQTLPREAKRSLDVERVWEARQQILAAVREHLDTQAGSNVPDV